MNTPFPNDLAGYQHLEPWVTIEDGDIYVEYGIPMTFCKWSVGAKVGETETLTAYRIYRKMPVAHQHDPLPDPKEMIQAIKRNIEFSHGHGPLPDAPL